MVYIIFLCLTIPMLLMLPLLEIRSRCIVGFMLLRTVTALSAYEINTIVYPMTGLSARSFSELVPPMTEELLKAMPVLLYAVLLDDRRNRVLPIAMAVGVGFAILENSMILIDNVGSVTVLWATARGFSASLMHGLCTVVAGTGITYTGTFGLLSISITMHALFNLLIQSDYDYIGMAMPLVLYGLIYWLYKGQRVRLPF